jgi:hypothetical protein
LAANAGGPNGFATLGALGILPVLQGGTGLSALGAGVQAALGNAAGGANGLATLNASGILSTSQGGTGLSALGTGVQAALAAATGTSGGLPVLGAGGVLPVANGGTGLSALGTGVQAALGNAAGGANGFAKLDANGILPTSQGGTGNSSPAGTVAVGSATQTGTLTIYNSGAGANPLSIQSAINTAPWTLTLPTGPGSSGQVLTTNGSGVTTWSTPAVVAGANTQVQYNNSGVLAANGGFTYDGASAITLGASSASIGRIVLNNATNANNVAVRSGTTTISYTLTLPTDAGTNGYLLATNGTGVLSWNSPASGTALNGNFDIGTPSTGGTPTTGTLNLFNSTSTDGVTISSGVNTSPWTLTLPTGPGTNGQLLTTNGTGATSWVSGNVTIGTTAIALGATSLTLAGLTSVTVTQDPTSGLQLATKQYVDAITSPIARTSPAECATTSNIALTGLQTIDGYTTIAGDRVLVKAQTLSQDDGVYVAAAGPWSRAADANQPAELTACACFVLNGTTLANTSWIQTLPIAAVGTDPQNWTQQAALNNYNAGLGINILGGNIIDNTGVVVLSGGSTGLTNTFTAATGTATLGGQLAITNGGTGAGTAAAALTNLLPTQGAGNAGKTLTTDGTNVSWTAPTAASATGGNFNVGTGGTTTGTLNLFNSTNANGVTLSSGVNTAAWTLTLPTGPGTAGQALVTNGSGVTSWTTVGSGTVNSGTANQMAFYSATGTAVSGNANVTVSAGALTLGVLTTTAGSLKLNGGTSGVITINTAAAAGTWSLTLPTTAGTTGQVLQTDGSGVTTWTTISGSGTVNSATANQIAYYSATGTAVSGNANATVSSGALTLGVLNTAAGSLKLNGGTSGVVTIQTAAAAGTWSMTVPTTAGTNGQVLQTDGSGVTTWATISGSGTVNSGTANQMAFYSATGTAVSGNANVTVSTAALTLGVASTTQGSLVLANTSANSTTIKSSNSATAAYSITLPTTAGTSGQVLATDGTGVTSWTTPIGYTRTESTATAAQTTFAATYTAGFVQVFVNGVLLALTDYTATNGTSVVLSIAANAGDIVTIINYK